MRIARLGIATALAIAFGCATAVTVDAQVRSLGKYAALGDQFYNDPDDDPPRGPRFADLESSIRTDSVLGSTDPGLEMHHTSARLLGPATDALRAAIPAGTAEVDAVRILRKAGARCSAAGSAELDCSYQGVAIPYGGEPQANVIWQVRLALADGWVSDLAVSRDWTRR